MARPSSLSGIKGFEARLVKFATAAILVLMLLPIVTVAILSFTSAATTQFPPPGFGLRWYRVTWSMLFGPDADMVRLREALLTSLMVGGATALVCLAVGLPAAYALVRYDFKGKTLVDELVDLPVIFPAIVLGIALLIVASALPFDPGVAQLIVAHSIIALPFMIRNIAASLHGLDPSLQEAANTLGATPLRAFAEIVLPVIRGGIASGLMIVFVLSFNEFTLTYFLSSVDVFPLSIWLFQKSNSTLDPSIFAVSTIIILINIAIIIVVDRLAGRAALVK
jgi:putative spermidine/putrescine transport system permease protein